MIEAVELNAEPKNVLVNSVKMFHNQIQFLFMNPKNSVQILYSIKAMIDSLDKESQEQLAPIRAKIVQYERTGKYYLEDLSSCFSELSIYLHKTYFREIMKGIVSTVTLPRPKGKPLKKAEPIPIILDAGID